MRTLLTIAFLCLSSGVFSQKVTIDIQDITVTVNDKNYVAYYLTDFPTEPKIETPLGTGGFSLFQLDLTDKLKYESYSEEDRKFFVLLGNIYFTPKDKNLIDSYSVSVGFMVGNGTYKIYRQAISTFKRGAKPVYTAASFGQFDMPFDRAFTLRFLGGLINTYSEPFAIRPVIANVEIILPGQRQTKRGR